MARGKRSGGEAVSLFPFLSILACVIGVLTLLITALALGQMDPQGISRAELYQRVQDQMKIDQREADELKKLIADAEGVRKQLEQARAELKLLQQEQQQRAAKDPAVALLAEANRLRNRITELQTDLATLRADIQRLQAELKQRKEPTKEAQITVLPGGSGVNLKPFFVECTATGIVLHTGAEPQRIRRADMAKSRPFLDLLDKIADTQDGTVIFLLRPDAVSTYYAARNIARAHYCRNGKLPLTGYGKLDLSMFR